MVVADFELEHFPKKSPILLKYGLAYQGIKGQDVVVDAIIPIDSTTIMVDFKYPANEFEDDDLRIQEQLLFQRGYIKEDKYYTSDLVAQTEKKKEKKE
jgi:hypothetical protein